MVGKGIIKKVNYFLYYGRIVKRKKVATPIRKVAILYEINPKSKKASTWHDGFTAAVDILKKDYEVTYINFYNQKINSALLQELNSYDFLLVKSNWRSPIDLELRKNYQSLTPALGLMISGSKLAPSSKEQAFYDVIWYESNWYKNYAVKHSNAFHGFGIDTTYMKPKELPKRYDWVLVGAPKKYKRIHRILEKEGRRLLIGDMKNKDPYTQNLLKKLQSAEVEILDFVSYAQLSDIYNESITCLVPTTLHGGGERSVLEARACGIEVEIASDNPKNEEFMHSPIYDEKYYADQLKAGIKSIE